MLPKLSEMSPRESAYQIDIVNIVDKEKGLGFMTTGNGDNFSIHVRELIGATGLSDGDTVSFDAKWVDDRGKYFACSCTVSGNCGEGNIRQFKSKRKMRSKP